VADCLQPKNPILFIDEIHRFSKSAGFLTRCSREKAYPNRHTTENPSFEVIPALLSRCQVYVLNRLQKIDLETLLERAHEKRCIEKKC
jgi:putative ATPase